MTTPPATTTSPLLLSPFDLRGLPLRNRLVMAPLTQARAGRERVPNELMVEYYTISNEKPDNALRACKVAWALAQTTRIFGLKPKLLCAPSALSVYLRKMV